MKSQKSLPRKDAQQNTVSSNGIKQKKSVTREKSLSNKI